MMNSAYNQSLIYNLNIIKLAKRWWKHGLIQDNQYKAISEYYKTPLFHPNIAIRILLFIATLIAASGVSGLVMLVFSDAGQTIIAVVSILFGVAAFAVLEKMFIRSQHFKSGVTEGVTYIACGYVVGGVAMLVDFEKIFLIQAAMLLVFAIAAFRYLDLLLTFAFMVTLSWTIFYHCYEAGGILKNIIPFVFMVAFSVLFFVIRKVKDQATLALWSDNLLLLEVCCLLLIYAGGNYLVVRELSIELMDLELLPGEDIPFAYVFLCFTVMVPFIYIVSGVNRKNSVWIRVGFITLAFAVYTFKHYFLPDYTEVFLMVTGGLAIMLAITGMRYLKAIRMGFTSENILTSEWANLHVEAFIISQTMGGNQPDKVEIKETGGGGSTGGGGASSSF